MSEVLTTVKKAVSLWAEGQKSFDKASKVLSNGPASYFEKCMTTANNKL